MVIWKGIDFRNKGIIVEHTPKISKANKKIETYTVPGRNGFVSVDTNTYEPFSVPIECHFSEDANMDEIKEFLDGYGTLSFDGEREYTAIVNNAIEFEKVLRFKKFAVQFLVNPIAEDIQTTTEIIDSNDYEFSINDTYNDIFPILTIECTGDVSITINNQTFYLNDTDGIYILDCKNKVIKDSNGNNASSNMLYDFPKLKKGLNQIEYTGDITSFEIEYKKTYL